jgi:transcriptional regulator with XRE-family HTH domain
MDMQQRRNGFAKRFNAALEKSGHAGLSDGDLVKLLARNGVAVTTQTVSNWRNAKHMPKLEQIEGLAGMLVIPPGELAFGTPRIAESKTTYRDAGERQLVEAFALLGEDERALVRELMRVLTNRAMQQGKRPGPRKRR